MVICLRGSRVEEAAETRHLLCTKGDIERHRSQGYLDHPTVFPKRTLSKAGILFAYSFLFPCLAYSDGHHATLPFKHQLTFHGPGSPVLF